MKRHSIRYNCPDDRGYDHSHPDPAHVMRCYRKHILGCKRSWGTARGLVNYRALLATYLAAKAAHLDGWP